MSVNLAQVDVSSSGSFNLNLGQIAFKQIAWIEFLNESPYTLTLNVGGINIQIPAWYDYPLQLQSQRNVPGNKIWTPISGAQEPVSVTPMLIANNLVTSMSTILLSTLYLLGEIPAITTPQPLFRQGYIPNNVNNVGGLSSGIQNDGNIANTNIIEATVSGDSTSAVTLTNDAVMVLGNSTHKGSLTTAGPASFDNTVEISNSGTESRILELNGADFRFDSPNGTQVARIANNGDFTAGATGGSGNLIGAHLELPHGHKLTAISFFTGSAGNSGSSVAHNLGVVPDGVIVLEQSTGSDTGTFTYNSSTISSTNVTIYNSNATPRSFFGVAFKFN